MKKFTALFKPFLGVSLAALVSACAGSQAEAEEPPMDASLETENERAANGIQQDPAMGDEEVQVQPEEDPASVRPNGDQVSTGEIESFVECHLKLIQLGQRMNARLQQGESAEVLNREFRVQAQGVIEESSLSEGRYMEIAKLAELDPSLRAKIEAAVREMVSG